jgi:hypothetical protein
MLVTVEVPIRDQDITVHRTAQGWRAHHLRTGLWREAEDEAEARAALRHVLEVRALTAAGRALSTPTMRWRLSAGC